jgi:peptide-methionine (S)-S-oxide reductase
VKTEVAVFGGGCFWCTEAVFNELGGVICVMPGYAGGSVDNPTYEQVCSGWTGHAEVIRIEFDPSQVTFTDLLKVFFATHDPTSLNYQGNDVGTQYRSTVLYASEQQKREAEALIRDFNNTLSFGKPVVTSVEPLGNFYQAEGYHHQYYTRNTNQAYCRITISPKLRKLHKQFAALLKSSSKAATSP